MMSITPTTVFASVSPRPYAGVLGAAPSTRESLSFHATGGSWVCGDHMSTKPNAITVGTNGSKRLNPGPFVGVLT